MGLRQSPATGGSKRWHDPPKTGGPAYSGPEVPWDAARLDRMWGQRVTLSTHLSGTFCDMCNCPVSSVEHFSTKLHNTKKANKAGFIFGRFFGGF